MSEPSEFVRLLIQHLEAGGWEVTTVDVRPHDAVVYLSNGCWLTVPLGPSWRPAAPSTAQENHDE